MVPEEFRELLLLLGPLPQPHSVPPLRQDQYWGFVTNAHKNMAPELFQKFLHTLGPAPQLLQLPQVITQEDRTQHLPARAPKVERPKLTQPHRLQHLPARDPEVERPKQHLPARAPKVERPKLTQTHRLQRLPAKAPEVERPKLTQPHQPQHLPAKPSFAQRLPEKGHKVLPLPKARDAYLSPSQQIKVVPNTPDPPP